MYIINEIYTINKIYINNEKLHFCEALSKFFISILLKDFFKTFYYLVYNLFKKVIEMIRGFKLELKLWAAGLYFYSSGSGIHKTAWVGGGGCYSNHGIFSTGTLKLL